MHLARPIVLLTAVLLLPRGSLAQANPVSDSARARNDCRLASQVLTSSQPANKVEWAAGAILRCGDAAIVLGQALAQTAPGSAEEVLVVRSALKVSDRHLLDAVIAILDDGARPAAKQLAALSVAATLVNPETLVEPERYAIAEWGVLVGLFDNEPVPGPMPITEADRTRALDAMTRLSASASDPLVRRVARALDLELRLLR
jgi:hypothetical protein